MAMVPRRLLTLVLFTGATYALGCGPTTPPARPPRPLVTRYDSMLDSAARAQGPEWRALHYPIASLHGPYPRPELADTSADPNDALSYYRLGDSVRRALPGLADRAFYWALRLDPTFADAYFARWTLLRREFPWREMPDGSIRRIFVVQPNALLATDSLLGIAVAYSPFLEGSLDFPRWIINVDERRAVRDPIMAGVRAYRLGEYRKAVAEWAKAMQKEPAAALLHVPRAYAWVRLNEPDSAIGDLMLLIKRLELVQRDSSIATYYSKEYLYYAIGMLHATKQRYEEARAAFEQALLENLGFYMAHVRLAGTAALLQDTTTALNELQTASLIRADDPLALVYHASLLISAGRVPEAERQLEAALRADSDYALPHVFLGLAAETRHDTATARGEYGRYLARAPRNASERTWASIHLNKLYSR
ncbi:MAG TPA: tetratricopeptide repeat protein [Gemmatimonadaceae bacterium]|nr:tetratricopeptide repeat protein [Gemmatimonadaceae bacterium]